MAVSLTLCSYCTQSRPEIMATIARIQREYPGALIVEELSCIAACEDAPAIMIGYDYLPRITPQELYQRVTSMIEASRDSARRSLNRVA